MISHDMAFKAITHFISLMFKQFDRTLNNIKNYPISTYIMYIYREVSTISLTLQQRSYKVVSPD